MKYFGTWLRGACLAVAAVAGLAGPAAAQTEPVKIGILHSLSGTMAISETTLKDVMLMLIDEQNKKGGVLGRKLEAGGGRPGEQLAAVCGEGARADHGAEGWRRCSGAGRR